MRKAGGGADGDDGEDGDDMAVDPVWCVTGSGAGDGVILGERDERGDEVDGDCVWCAPGTPCGEAPVISALSSKNTCDLYV